VARPQRIVSRDLASELGVGTSGIVAFVGAGGKTTLSFRLATDLAARGGRVVVTTTTKIGADQMPPGAVVADPDPAAVAAGFASSSIVLAVTSRDGHKATGPAPDLVADLLSGSGADHVLVEADGARRLPLKAPDAHEPVIPPGTTLVVVCAGLDAVGRTFAVACHRPHLAATLAGRRLTDPIRPEDMAAILGHPDGGLKGVPSGARVVVALTKAIPGSPDVGDVARALDAAPGIDRVVVVPWIDPGPSTHR
jgi:molybdenum cofactor cytidylyltransferase